MTTTARASGWTAGCPCSRASTATATPPTPRTGRTIFIAADSGGLARGENGDATTELENPGSVLTFTYEGDD